jgi:hypothetical protein
VQDQLRVSGEVSDCSVNLCDAYFHL